MSNFTLNCEINICIASMIAIDARMQEDNQAVQERGCFTQFNIIRMHYLNIIFMKQIFIRNVLKFTIGLLLIVLGIPPCASAQTVTSNNIIYTIDPVAGTAECTGRASWGQDIFDKYFNIVIPDEIEYNWKKYPVTSIADKAFYNLYASDKSAINGTLIIGKNVMKIGNLAFGGQKELKGELHIPDSVTEIGALAFEDCSGFTGTLVIPSYVINIGGSAFKGCTGFTGSLAIPNSVTKIGSRAFEGCRNFGGSLTLSNSLTEIEMGVFDGCKGFTGTLIIPSSVTKIGSSAFFGCSGFTGSLTIPETVTSIGAFAFRSCEEIDGTLSIPNSVTYMGQGAFQYCSELDTLIVGNGIENIETNTFEACNFRTIVLPSGLKECYGLKFYPNTTVYCAALIPPVLTLWGSGESGLYNTKLYVPANSIDKYKGAGNQWRYFERYEDITNPSQVAINLDSETIWPGDSVQLEATVLPDFDFTDRTVKWSSSLSSVAKVSDNGLVKAYKSGTATIRAITKNNLEATAEIKVIGLKMPEATSLSIWETCSLEVTAYPRVETLPDVTWTSSDESVATVDNKGTVTAISKGTSIVRASVANNPYAFAECMVTVNNPNIRISEYEELLLGESTTLQVRAYPDFGYIPALVWSSSDPGIVSINEGGVITARGLGSATIKVAVADDPDTYASCRVDVYYSDSDRDISYSFGDNPNSVIIKSIPNLKCYIIPAYINVPTKDGEKVCAVQEVRLQSMPEKLQKVAYPSGIETNFYNSIIKVPYDAHVCRISGNSIVNTSTNTLVFIDMAAIGEYEITTDIAAVGKHAFDLCREINAINIADCDMPLTFEGDRNTGAAFSTISPVNLHVGRNISYEVSPFRENDSITNLTFGKGITEIGDFMFYGCKGIRELNLPASLTHIDRNAFSNCSGLSQLLFQDCSDSIQLDDSAFSDTPADYLYYGRNVVCNNGGVFNRWPKTIKAIETGRYIESLSGNEFVDMPNIYSLIIGVGIRNIADNSFAQSTITKVIWMPNTPPKGYRSIAATINYVSTDKYEFDHGQTVFIPNLSSSFYQNGLMYAFNREVKDRTCAVIDNRYNRYITKLDVPHILKYQNIDFTVDEISDYALYSNKYYQTASIGDGITRIGKYALFNCTTINVNPYLGKALKMIDDYAFNSCTSIPAIDIPDATEYLGEWSLANCTGLNNILLGKGLTTIESGCFANDVSLSQIAIPTNVLKISNRVFDGCKSLEYLEIKDRIHTISMGYSRHSDIYDPAQGVVGGLSSAGIPLFADCPLKEVYIGGDISYSISPADGYSPFYRNDAIQKVVINNNETEISDNEFYGCR